MHARAGCRPDPLPALGSDGEELLRWMVAHPSGTEAWQRCPRADWLLNLALWNAADDADRVRAIRGLCAACECACDTLKGPDAGARDLLAYVRARAEGKHSQWVDASCALEVGDEHDRLAEERVGFEEDRHVYRATLLTLACARAALLAPVEERDTVLAVYTGTEALFAASAAIATSSLRKEPAAIAEARFGSAVRTALRLLANVLRAGAEEIPRGLLVLRARSGLD